MPDLAEVTDYSECVQRRYTVTIEVFGKKFVAEVSADSPSEARAIASEEILLGMGTVITVEGSEPPSYDQDDDDEPDC